MGKELRHVHQQAATDPSGSDQTNELVWVNQTGSTVNIRKVSAGFRGLSTGIGDVVEWEVSKMNAFLADGDEQWRLNGVGRPPFTNAQIVTSDKEYFYEGGLELEAGDAMRGHLNGSGGVGAGEFYFDLSYNI